MKYFVIIMVIIVSLLIFFGINWNDKSDVDSNNEIIESGDVGVSVDTAVHTDSATDTFLSKEGDASDISDTLNLKDFNVVGSGKDETSALQNALEKSSGKTLYIPKQRGSYYLVGQLIVPSNITIICHPEVIFMAKNDLKQDFSEFEVMWRFENSENVVFDGGGAVFRMDKSKYGSEFNHTFMINGSKNVTVKNVKAIESAGDGFYVGAIRTKRPYPEDIRIENCLADRSTRQGLSVTSAENLVVSNSSFNSSKGKSPEAGVDIEPFNSKGVLRKIQFINCKAIGNAKRGFMVNLMRLNESSDPVDVVFEGCFADRNMEGFSNRSFKGVQGTVEMNNCTVKNSKFSGITESTCLANSIKKIYRNCVVENSNTLNKNTQGYASRAGFYLRVNSKNGQKDVIGNSVFIDCNVINDNNSHYGLFVDNGGLPTKDISVTNLNVKGQSIKSIHRPAKF